jgi:hypothetical protein
MKLSEESSAISGVDFSPGASRQRGLKPESTAKDVQRTVQSAEVSGSGR